MSDFGLESRVNHVEDRLDGVEHVDRMRHAEICARLDAIADLLQRVISNQGTERDRVDAVERDIVDIKRGMAARKKK